MSDYNDVLGMAVFFFTMSFLTLSGGGEYYVFNFNYANQSVSGEEINLDLQDFENSRYTYYDEETDKLRVNQTATAQVTSPRPIAYYNSNVSGIETYIIEAEVNQDYYNVCNGEFLFEQGLTNIQLSDGTNRIESLGSTEFRFAWQDAFLDNQTCQNTLFNSNITSIEAEFPSATERSATQLIGQFTDAESNYNWFNIIFMGSFSVLVGYIILKLVRGS